MAENWRYEVRDMEPPVGFEPTTWGLQIPRSSAELRRLKKLPLFNFPLSKIPRA